MLLLPLKRAPLSIEARTIRIRGRIQGVFFREWTVQLAAGLSVTGWVRNRDDGSVEVLAMGEPELLDRFVDQLREGSPASRVKGLEQVPAAVEPLESFTRCATV